MNSPEKRFYLFDSFRLDPLKRLLLRDGVACVEDLSTYGSFINEERVHGQAALRRGDRLRLGAPGIVLEAIALVDEHAAPPV